MKNKNVVKAPLKSWDFYSNFFHEQIEFAVKNTDLEILNEFKNKYSWNINFESFIYNIKYEAIVLTNSEKEIEWVNKGFSNMTGYPKSFSKGKKPTFLQGENSSKQTLKRINKKIATNTNFKEKIVNYRKNGEEYNCEINIYPLKNVHTQVTHFIAFEKEV